MMRREWRARNAQEKEEDNAAAKVPAREFIPKFETIAKGGSEVKVMYAVPKRNKIHSSSGAK